VPESRRTGAARRLLRDSVTVFAHAVLISLMRAFGGFADGWCVSASCISAQAAFPYLGGGIGYAF